MFIKLLATKMVANNFLGLSSNLVKIGTALDFSPKPSSKSVLLKENNATSAPEISAEQISRIKSSTKPRTIEISAVNKLMIKLGGSGSNYQWFS